MKLDFGLTKIIKKKKIIKNKKTQISIGLNSNSWRRQWHPTPVLWPGTSHGRRSLEGCSPWGHWRSNTTEQLHFHFSLSCIGEGNGNPLQCSCLENPRNSGAWWAAVYGIAQSRTQLKRLSSSSSSSSKLIPGWQEGFVLRKVYCSSNAKDYFPKLYT